MKSPLQPTDDAARDLAQKLLCDARFAALAVVLEDGSPLVTRVAFGRSASGQPLSLISGLAAHTRALQVNPACSVLIGEPGIKGDPLTHPRLSLQATATFVHHHSASFKEMAAHYLRVAAIDIIGVFRNGHCLVGFWRLIRALTSAWPARMIADA